MSSDARGKSEVGEGRFACHIWSTLSGLVLFSNLMMLRKPEDNLSGPFNIICIWELQFWFPCIELSLFFFFFMVLYRVWLFAPIGLVSLFQGRIFLCSCCLVMLFDSCLSLSIGGKKI